MPKNVSLYKLYEHAVQEPEAEIEFWKKAFQECLGFEAKSMREDFCATFINSCEWVKHSKEYTAMAIDIDSEPLSYGQKAHYANLKDHQKQRLQVIESDVLKVKEPKVDLVTVSNFSICFFKDRQKLLEYFKYVHAATKSKAALCLDLLGGTEVEDQDYEEREFKVPGNKTKYTYFWEQEYFNPITRETLFHIHFQAKGEKKIEKAFSYDWRLWTIPELKDILLEAGFSDVTTYWEGDDGDGNGSGEFEPETFTENCESWIAYVMAVK